LLHRETI